jgi:hypothetical protein
MHRFVRFVATAAFAAVALAVPGISLAAGSNPPPTTEVLNGDNTTPGPFSSAITCQSPTTGTLHFTISGAALGPYPGTFTESGTIEITNGVVTAFSASFNIISGNVTIQGTKSGPIVFRGSAECAAPSPDFGPGTNFFHAGPFDATYQLTITGPLGTNSYSGTVGNDFNFTSGAFASGGMQQGFLSAEQPPPTPVCATSADQDNDGLIDSREPLFLTLLGVSDSDHDGVKDGNDDANHNGVDDEDEDDNGNHCENDSDHDGVNDEDEDD